MEEFHTEDQEDKKKKKRRIPSFLSTWLKRTDESSQETTEPKKPFSERAWKVFQNFLSREAERPEKIEEQPTKEPQQFLEFVSPLVEQSAQSTAQPAETVSTTEASEARPEAPKRTEQEPTQEQPNEGGELTIDHEDEELEDTLPTIEELTNYEQPPEVEPPIIPLQRQAEIAALDEYDRAETTAAVSQPEKIGDVLERRQKQTERDQTREKQRNRRRNRKLKNQVYDLKHDTTVQSKQQETLKKEQADLQNQVEQLRQQPDVSQLIARQERERTELRANRGIETSRPLSRPPEQLTPVKTEAAPMRSAESVSRQPEIEPPKASARPEIAFPLFEQSEQQDTRSEREFERRHEAMDEAGSSQATSYAALASADAAYRAAAAQVQQATDARSYQLVQPPLPAPQPAFQASDLVDSPMYRQAMRNGFLTAVILLAVWLAMSLIS